MTSPARLAAPAAWSRPPHDVGLRDHEVHVWLASLERTARTGQDLTALSPEELSRAGRYRFPRDRDRFAAQRALLRSLLGSYLHIAPDQVRFRYGSHGKPALAADGDGPALRFNVSGSHGVALFAFTLGQELGVDVERIDHTMETDEIARRFFSGREVEELLEVPRPLRTPAFFGCWTRKEAYLKARGDGLSLALDGFDVSVRPGEPPTLRRAGQHPEESARFSFEELPPVDGFAVALCVEGRASGVRCWRWPGH